MKRLAILAVTAISALGVAASSFAAGAPTRYPGTHGGSGPAGPGAACNKCM